MLSTIPTFKCGAIHAATHNDIQSLFCRCCCCCCFFVVHCIRCCCCCVYTNIHTHATYIYVCVDEQRVFYVWSPSLCHPAFHRASIRRPFLFCFWNQNKNTTQSTVSVTIRLRTWMHYKYTFLLVLRMFCCFSVMWLDTLSLSMVPLPNTILEVDCGLE